MENIQPTDNVDPNYNTKFKFIWKDNFSIETSIEDNLIIIKANKEGLESLAEQLLLLSKDTVPNHYHIHYDEFNSLEDGSIELIIEKNDKPNSALG